MRFQECSRRIPIPGHDQIQQGPVIVERERRMRPVLPHEPEIARTAGSQPTYDVERDRRTGRCIDRIVEIVVRRHQITDVRRLADPFEGGTGGYLVFR